MDKPTKNKNLQTANDKELRPFRERKVSGNGVKNYSKRARK